MERLSALDARLSLWIHGRCLGVSRLVLRILELSGDGLIWIPATFAVWFSPKVQSSLRLHEFVFSLALGLLLVDGLLVCLLKLIFRRPRPVYNKGMYLVVSADHWSFPSGHSSRALFLATSFWLQSDLWNKFLPAFISLWALTTAASRILLGRHFLFDVIAGSLLGCLEAWLVHRLIVPLGLSKQAVDLIFVPFKP